MRVQRRGDRFARRRHPGGLALLLQSLEQLVERILALLERPPPPVELLESCIARIEAVNPAVNALVAMDLDAARRSAREAEVLDVGAREGATLTL